MSVIQTGTTTADARVVVSIDEGPWQAATLTEAGDAFSWAFWTYDWGIPAAGEYTRTVIVVSVAVNGIVPTVPPGPVDTRVPA